MKLITHLQFLAIALLLLTSTQAVETKKLLVLSLNFTDGEVFFENADFLYRTPPNSVSKGDFYAKVISREGTGSYETFFKDPRKSFSETFYENGSIEGSQHFQENTQFKLVLGVEDNSSAVKIMDENQTTLLTIYLNELQVAKAFFCQVPNKVCDKEFCGETDVDCQEGKENALTQEKQENEIEKNLVTQSTQATAEANQGGKQAAQEGQTKGEENNYNNAVQVVYALILLLLAYVGASVVFKQVKNK